MYTTLKLENYDNDIVVCTLNRPSVRNALNEEMVNELQMLMAELGSAENCSVVVITGAGDKSFMSGADIAELKQRDASDALRQINNGLFRAIESAPFPTIAAINGYALGGGCELAMACDIRIAADHAKLGQPEVKLGIMPGAGATYRLPQLVGIGKAKELILTGKIITASEAEQIGLVNTVVKSEDLLIAAINMAREIAANGRKAVRFSKLALNTQRDSTIESAYSLETIVQAYLFDDDEKHSRMAEFLSKKKKSR